ncbi:glycosyltransferase family 4 protein [Terrabacter sp. NPDC080008]|uniref:glycosyltransferase family 4 protein n=1 Tax=Terrabacter sp. NPDC080008 TaxID=3155176 RepID=UPI00344FC5FA
MARRVALVGSSYHPHVGGVESHVRHVASQLRESGVDVEVWTVDRGEHLGVTELDGIVVRHLPTPLPAGSLSALASFAVSAPRAWRRWVSAFREFRPDVLHVQCFGPNGVYAAALARRTAVPLVVSSHGETTGDDHDVFGGSALLRLALRRAIASAAAVTGCSEPVLDDLRTRFGLVGGTVVPNGVGEPAPGSRSGAALLGADPPAGRIVLGVGRLGAPKGFDLLVEAFAELDPAVDATLVIVGDGPHRDVLTSLGDRLGLGDRLQLVGALDEAGVDAWMRRADVVVVPSRKEAFGIVALEAWRAGTPLVATALGGPASFVTDGVDGLLVDPVNTGALAGAVESVLCDPDLARRLSEAGLVSVRAYTWTRVARDYAAIYASIYASIAEPTVAERPSRS